MGTRWPLLLLQMCPVGCVRQVLWGWSTPAPQRADGTEVGPSPYVAVTLAVSSMPKWPVLELLSVPSRNGVISMLPVSPGVRYLLRGTERKWPSQVLESGPPLGFMSWQHWRAREALQTHPSFPGTGSSREGLGLPGHRAGLWWLQLRCVFSLLCSVLEGGPGAGQDWCLPDAQSLPPTFDVINILFHY